MKTFRRLGRRMNGPRLVRVKRGSANKSGWLVNTRPGLNRPLFSDKEDKVCYARIIRAEARLTVQPG